MLLRYVESQIPAGSVLSAQGPLFGAALAICGEVLRIRTRVYIDGFNFYYGAVKGTPFRWLNPLLLTRHLIHPACVIDKIKYFTARVSGAADPNAPLRQQLYLAALSTLPEIEIIYGRFLSKNIWRPITNFPVAGAAIGFSTPVSLAAGNHTVSGGSLSRNATLTVASYPSPGASRSGRALAPPSDALVAEVHSMEEKGSDVNIGAHLLNDAWKNQFDAAVVISNDTDLVTPIRMVAVERGKQVYVVCPGRWQMSPHLARVATYKRHIRRNMLSASQFPDLIPGTTIRKPPSW